jgi:hypothetical protein
MAENKKEGLPYKFGDKVPEVVAEGLVGAEAIHQAPAMTMDQVQAEHQVAAQDMLKKLEEERKEKAAGEAPVVGPMPTAGQAATPGAPPPPVGPPAVKECPRCGWDVNEAVNIEPTAEDKQNFLRHVILDNQPFYKQYVLYGGRVKVWFKTRPVEVAQIISRQHMLNFYVRYQGDPMQGNRELDKLLMTASIARLERYDEAGAIMSGQEEYPPIGNEHYPVSSAHASGDSVDAIWLQKHCPELVQSHRDGKLDPVLSALIQDKISEEWLRKNNPELATAVGRAEATIIGRMQEKMYQTLWVEFRKFEWLCAILASRGWDPDFCEATTSVA